MTFGVRDTSSVFEVDDCVSLIQDSINPYQCSMFTSPDTVKYKILFLSNLKCTVFFLYIISFS